MSWLSSLAGSVANTVISASASALSGGNNVPGLPGYTLGDKLYHFDRRSIWTVSNATKKDDSSSVTVFSFDLNAPQQPNQGAAGSSNDRKAQLVLAKNALRKLRALRHPHILKFLDGVDTDTTVWIVTEPVRSLSLELDSAGTPLAEESKVYGLLHLVTALAFLNKDGASIHGNIRPESVWITQGGEWKLGGMELTTRKDDDSGVIWNYAGLLPDARSYTSPEVRKGGWTALKEHEASALDSYQLYLLIFVIFNGALPPTFSSSSSPPTLPGTRGQTPQNIYTTWRRLGNPNPKARLRTDLFLELGIGSESGTPGWWPSNRLVKLSAALEGFSLASEAEKMELLKMLKTVSDANATAAAGSTKKRASNALPDEFLKYKVLSSLVRTFEFGGGGPALLPIILNLASGLSEQEYAQSIIQPLVRMFATPDRATRMALLEGLDKFADKLSNKDVTEKIWPHLLSGFGDVVPVIREATVKSVLLIAPKLSDRILNNDLLRLLARSQTDPEPGIRTNTCILLGRLSRHLQPSMNRKVLVPAFARALRDPFIHARIAGLMALMATADVYEKEDLAGKVIPAMSICLIDREKAVRDQGYKAIELFIKKCEQLTINMPETAATVDENGNPIIPGGVAGAGAASATSTTMAMKAANATQPGLATNAAGAAGALAGWAFASVSKKLSSAEAAAHMSAGPSIPASAILPPVASPPKPAGRATNGHGPQSSIHRPFQSSSLALPGGFDEDDEEDEDEDGSAGPEDWGQDLMDVNADEDDWDQFESGSSAPRKVDPLAARLSSTKPKPFKLGGSSANKASKMPMMDFDAAAEAWDTEEASGFGGMNKPASLASVRKPPPNLMASAVPAGPKQVVSLAPRPTRTPIAVNTSPRKPIRLLVGNTAASRTPMSPPRPSNSSVESSPRTRQLSTPQSPPPPPPAPNPFADIISSPQPRVFSPPPPAPVLPEFDSDPIPSPRVASPPLRTGSPAISVVSTSNETIKSNEGEAVGTGATVWMTKEEKMAHAREQRRLRMAQAKARAK
ncbi:BZ3500_MvSof-1268-A1-R1_Chr4-2g06919 [Microbotryum saponariae]|uniref:BZ3500_MvSof-1268-A1-R1_Chr4-2g06919 protein n=1 Tax=Microbotryum saponariae TaxID=289078 RepID=A0A2X0LHN8_9BASI|nr:BZ3500_MvSof-1268-A1-R1_Chr4-2g06919 [Microbotryum saponariae]SDA06584.1 BZ3501_MvSof-1269-A2-R1_Chr4-2g06630 [Microbotryum saponariae]